MFFVLKLFSKLFKKKFSKKQYFKNKYHTDLNYKTALLLRNKVRYFLKKNKQSSEFTELIGCSTATLKQHLEKNFSYKMNWKNYGRLWHIDHIRPCKNYDLSYQSEQKKCFNYTNLQPLLAKDNLSKGAKYNPFLNWLQNCKNIFVRILNRLIFFILFSFFLKINNIF